MRKKDVDPNEGLAADAVLAEDLGDEEERRLAQIAEMGGTIDEDIDNWDDKDLDRGDDPDYVPPAADDDGKTGDTDGETGDDKTDDEDDSDDSKDAEADDDGEADSDAAEADGEDDEADVSDDDSDTDDESDDDPAPKNQGIPKHRFDQVNERAKAAEAELARRDAAVTASKEAEVDAFDADTAEKEYMELMLDGKLDDALAKRKEINAAQEVKWKTETKAETRTDVDADASQAELNSLSHQAEEIYPVFDPNHADFDQDLTDTVLIYYQGYVQSGKAKNQGDAFVMALADVVDKNKLDDRYGETDAKPKEDSKPKPTGKDKVDPKKQALRDKVHTPVAGEGTSSDSSGAVVPDIEKMSDEELEALPEKTMARLRGDFI